MPTKVIKSIEEWMQIRSSIVNQSIGLVMTMGNLHEGHMSLVRRSKSENDVTLLSCFVNPAQFNNKDDYQKYPRTLQDDIEKCDAENVDYFFVPEYEAMYPDDYNYQVSEKRLTKIMEGKHRPGHFDGMLTIVLKMILLSKAKRAYFGEKDYQQLKLVQGMVEAFFVDTEIVSCSTVREAAGLALSSRNNRLNEEQYERSQLIHKLLSSQKTCDEVVGALQSHGFEVEYVEEYQGRRFVAVQIGGIRLIDNVEVTSC